MAGAQHSDQAKKAEPTPGVASKSLDGAGAASERAANNHDNLSSATEAQDQVADGAQRVVQIGVEALSRNAREMINQTDKFLGFGGEDGERFAKQARRNVEALARCGTVLSQAYQDAWQNAFDLGRKRWQRNLEGLNRLARARSMQEFAMLQSEVTREGLQNLAQDTRTVAERSLKAVEEAGRICAEVRP